MSLSNYTQLGTKVWKDVDADSTIETLTGALTIHALEIDNTQNTADSFLKIWDNATPTLTTPAEFILRVESGKKLPLILGSLFEGVTFTNNPAFACVTTGGDTGSTSPTNDVKVTFITN